MSARETTHCHPYTYVVSVGFGPVIPTSLYILQCFFILVHMHILFFTYIVCMCFSLADAIATMNMKKEYSERELSQAVVTSPSVKLMNTAEQKGVSMHISLMYNSI